MKTLTGKVISSTPISLSKASNALSNFVSGDTGASQAVSAYLRRAIASFDDLVQLHKDLKPHSSKPTKAEEKHANKRKKSEEGESGGAEQRGGAQRSGSGKKKKKRRVGSEE